MRCPYCGKMTPDDSVYCGNCGEKLPLICSGCGKEVIEFLWPEYKLCLKCGGTNQPSDPGNEDDYEEDNYEDDEPREVNLGDSPGGFKIYE